jgi:nitrate reductase NapE component
VGLRLLRQLSGVLDPFSISAVYRTDSLGSNTTSYPLLLIQSLDQTGILTSLVEDEGTKAGIERAKSYFLVFATVSSCLTFAVGPRLMEGEHAPEPNESDKNSLAEEEEEEENGTEPRGEETLLLPPSERGRHASVASVSFFPSGRRESNAPPKPIHASQRRPSTLLISKRKWYELSERTQWWLLFFYDFLNAPLIGAVLGAVIGLVPALHKAFFADSDDGGIFTAWLTASLQNIGSLFVPLPVVIAGVSLYLSAQKKPSSSSSEGARSSTPWATTLFVLFIRFVLWPVVSIAIIYGAGKGGWLGDDKMFWFALMLMPTGPPAMKLITMVEVSDASEEDEHKIAQLLTISYVVSPVLAFTVVGSLRACVAAAS